MLESSKFSNSKKHSAWISNKDFAFCTLALGQKYRLLAKELAKDLEVHSSGTMLVVGTDQPGDFSECANVIAFKQFQKGVLHCYHDKRFVIEKTLTKFSVAIQIDADTRIVSDLPQDIEWPPGITAGHTEALADHVKRYNLERLTTLQKIARKLNISLDDSIYIGESLFAVCRDNGKEKKFLKYWDIIARYLELNGIHSGEGNAIGLAAAKAELNISTNASYETINQARKHIDASLQKSKKKTLWAKTQNRLSYHYRLNLTRAIALKDFELYYR
ncbi:MAG: hypothetical protein HC833_24155 [Leptolyngbyaceae cyanobacterium RM1_406_9]|nr:hypothetical protein [Leptolyngbyaceae cyanobacterium RM1_406_9]